MGEYLRPNGKHAVEHQAGALRVAKLMADQACFHQLELVCSKFRDVFAEHPQLSNEITISKPSSATDAFVPAPYCGFSAGAVLFAAFNPYLESNIMNWC